MVNNFKDFKKEKIREILEGLGEQDTKIDKLYFLFHYESMPEKARKIIDIIKKDSNINQIEIAKKINSAEGYTSKLIKQMYIKGILVKDIISRKFSIIDGEEVGR